MKKIIQIWFFFLLIGLYCVSIPSITVLADDIKTEDFLVESNYTAEGLATSIDINIETEAEPNTSGEPTKHYIGWTFSTYFKPDFQSEVAGSYPPQDILIHEMKEDGWALIYTDKGVYWANLNKVYIDKYIPIYDNKGDTSGVGNISAQVVRVIEQEENWILIETWLGEKWIDLNALRKSVLLDVPLYNQRNLGYPTGCEIVSTAMMINYTTEVSVKTLVSEMPRSQNPSNGFRGNPATSGGFTIYPQALLKLTDKYLGNAQDMSGCEIDDLKRKLNDNTPVVTWVVGLSFNVHAICLTGYDESGFYYNDPWTGKKDAFITYNSFYKIWNKPIYDRIYGNSYPARKALSYNP